MCAKQEEHGVPTASPEGYSILTMYDVHVLCERYGLSVKQVRDRLTALSPVLHSHVRQGKHGAKLLTDGGLAIFDRLRELERGELSVSDAVAKIKNERAQAKNPASSTSVGREGADGESAVIELLNQQVRDLRAERDRLLEIIEGQGEQLQALMPGGEPGPPKRGGHREQRMSRWQHFKAAILGE